MKLLLVLIQHIQTEWQLNPIRYIFTTIILIGGRNEMAHDLFKADFSR